MQVDFSKWNTLRNQMLFGFLAVMVLIVGGVGFVTFHSVSSLLKNNAEKNIQQTAIQANGRLEGILQQIDMLTTQVATNTYIQKLLLDEKDGKPAPFSERQLLPKTIYTVQLYADGVQSVELYNYERRKLYPLDTGYLQDKVKADWIARTVKAKGGIVWFGVDPDDPDSLLAIRQITLINQDFSPGGYLLVRLDRDLFDLEETSRQEAGRNRMLLVGSDGQVITSTLGNDGDPRLPEILKSSQKTVTLDEMTYMVVRKKSEITGWTLFILTPVDEITKGISVLRNAIVISAAVGALLYVALSFLLSTAITKPIFKLIRTMRGARIGRLRPVADPSSTIEIRELSRSYNEMIENINNLIRLVYEKEIVQSRTELKALQAQINPHFLFNTLEALYRSLDDKNDTELAEFVLAMSELFRYTISKPNKDEWVALGRELEHVERYLLIMKTRLGDRLRWSIDCPADLASHMVPKLLVQPIVENAIAHGIEGRLGPGTVSVSVSLTDSQEELVIAVNDDGAGMDEDKLAAIEQSLSGGQVPSAKGSGLGIANVHRRIRLSYASAPPSGGIAIRSRKGEGTRVHIIVPYKLGVAK